MKVLHYTLGFQPQRTGGLVKYAEDLMMEQVNQGHQVVVLYPGNIKFFSKKTAIKKVASKSFDCYELRNSLPLALFGGISDPIAFMTPCEKAIYRSFLKNVQPDAIHLHSIIGLHKEFLEVAKDLGIKVFFTSHDYYGLAPVPNFYFNGVDYSADNTNLSWNIMSTSALSVKKLRFFQVPFYPTLRKMMKLLGKNPKAKKNLLIQKAVEKHDYSNLRCYYQQMFDLIDGYLFNSSIAKKVYEQNEIKPSNSIVASISNSSIKHHQRLTTTNNKIRVAYIGPDEEYKGYYDFVEFAKMVDKKTYEIATYGHLPNEECPSFIEQKGYFSKNQVADVYSQIDILIVPSKWKETFGFIAVEALSYGVNVFVSENVGSKDLVNEDHIFKELEDLLDKIKSVVAESKELKTMQEHSSEVVNYYQSINA